MTPTFNTLLAGAVGLALVLLAAPAPAAAPAPSAPQTRSPSHPNAPPLRIQVDPRVELFSLLFRLAGNPEYSQGRVAAYTADVEQRFGKFRDHPAVKLARQLRQRRGVSFDACMSMAVHLDNASALRLLVPLEPWPEGLDRRWTAPDAARFLAAARQFVKDTAFLEFIQDHRPLYETTESRMRTLMEREAHLEWFKEYFGQRPQAAFTLAPGLLNGGSCYGVHCRDAAGKENLYCILGVWKTDQDGLPQFTHDMLGTVVHEFTHSHANQIVDRHLAELAAAGEKLFHPVAAVMASQAYGESATMLRESLVRACVIRYTCRYDGPAAARRAVAYEKERGFAWIEELSKLLADEYEPHRDHYGTLETFAPRLVAFFDDYAQGFAQRQAALDARRPKVLSMTPANGATDVDPNLTSIQVVFDRPMKDRSWALCGEGPHCPQAAGPPHYDAARTTWTVPVKLTPNWSYQFMLNSAAFDAFRSADNVPLQPLSVTFQTGKGPQPSGRADAQ